MFNVSKELEFSQESTVTSVRMNLRGKAMEDAPSVFSPRLEIVGMVGISCHCHVVDQLGEN